MSVNLLFQELNEDDLTQALCEILAPRLVELLNARSPGHCMRVANLEPALMKALCRALREQCPAAQVYILHGNGTATAAEEEQLFISSTKLVELRNPLPDGSQRPPLLVFLPVNLHASAEDSFSIATFEDISLSGAYKELKTALLERVPTPLQGYIQELFAILTSSWWPWADDVARVRFLLTALKNRVDGESLGASLYELGLVPDFQLLKDPPLMQNRIRRNLESMRTLTYSDASPRGRVLELGLSDRTLLKRLTNFLATVGVVDPSAWTRQIVINKQNWDISFDKWKFIEEISKDKVSIQIISLGLKEISEDEAVERLEGLSGQRVLDPTQQNRFSVTFTVDPHPARVSSLDYLTVQILTKDGEPVGGARKISVHNWGVRKQEHTIHLDKLNRLDFEDGWHKVRILPWTKEGEQVPLDVEPEPAHIGLERRKPHESEPFYVIRGESEIIDPPQRAIPYAASLEHARLHSQFRECTEQRDPQAVQVAQMDWLKRGSKVRQHQELLEIKFTRGGKYHVQVSSHLKSLECQILNAPRNPVCWLWNTRLGTDGTFGPTPEIVEWPKSLSVESFLDAREQYFVALKQFSLTEEAITQTADLGATCEACLAYAEAYRDLLADLAKRITQSRGSDQQKAIAALRTVLLVDSVHMVLSDIRGHVREATLIGPTHPLRALWFATWARLGQEWLAAARQGPEEHIGLVRDGLLRALTPFNIPAALPCVDGRIFLTVDNLTPFWSLYAPPGESDTRGLLGEVCSMLGLPEPAISGEAISPEILATRIGRYLIQHPYIRTLSVNAFNPGHATLLAQALLLLQKEEIFAGLRYDVRLFVPDPSAPRIGEALESLLTPNAATSTDLTDAFSLPGLNHLFPKLSLAIHPLAAFQIRPQDYRAHLSLLFDLFPAEEIAAGAPFSKETSSPVHGLVQEFETLFQDDEDGTFWRRQPRHGKVRPFRPDAEEVDEPVALLAELESTLSGMTATVATGLPAFEQRPIVALSLRTDQRELIHYVHDVSDWVITIDRNIGIEFFDHGKRDDRADYLIDYTPGIAPGSGYQLIITSRAMLELEATLRPFLAAHGLPADQGVSRLILDQLRALSGRVALKFISSSTQQMEALGLALARLFLIQQGALTNQLILPLDVHLELFHTVRRASDELGEAVTLQRTDLALFDLDAGRRVIRCNLVEVKCYNQVGGASAYAQLKERINEQLAQSEETLRRHFDPRRKQPDRPDRLLKTRELATLLSFYLGRSERYGMLQPDAAAEARFLLATLEDGYTLEFSQSALIFDFEKNGLTPEPDPLCEFYRVGRDQIEALLQEALEAEPELSSASVSTPEERWARPPSSLSRLPSAAFLAPERERTVSRDNAKYDEQAASTKMVKMLGTQEYSIDEESAPDEDGRFSARRDEADGLVEEQKDVQEPAGIAPAESVYYELDEQQASLHAEPEAASGSVQPIPLHGEHPSGSAWQAPLRGESELASGSTLYDVMLGVQGASPQYGLLGELAGRKVALDLNQTHTISLFGVQGSGKSYTLGSIIEMACLDIPHVNVLPSPLATVVFHYSPTQDYKPEFTSMVRPNADEGQVAQLRAHYGAEPRGLKNIVLLVPASKLEIRRKEYPDLEVLPLTFAASELKVVHWKFLMGAVGSSSMYIRQINLIMKKLRDRLTLDALRTEVDNSALSDTLKDLAHLRLQFAAEYIDDSRRLSECIQPGRLIIVDIRDEFIEKDEALGLFVVLLQIFSEATYQGKMFNKLVVFDEAHKYMENQDLVSGLIEVVREMRHKGTSILVASQDPPSVPISLIELSSQIIMHRCNSPAWLKHIQKANSALNNLTPEKMSRLGAGEAYVWSARSSDEGFTRGAVKIHCRPRITRHGGETKTAVSEE
jgi:DNA phosphorothioation-dependent restriction protein DptH